MEAILTALVPNLSAEALKAWGSFAAVLLILGWQLWRQSKTIDALRTRVEQLQDLRLQDAREMTRVVEASTAASTARAQGDALSQELMKRVVMQAFPGIVPALPAPPTGHPIGSP